MPRSDIFLKAHFAAITFLILIAGIIPVLGQSAKKSSEQKTYHEKLFKELPLNLFVGKSDQEKQKRIDELKQKKYLIVYKASPTCGFCKEVTPRVANFYNKYYNNEKADCGVLLVVSSEAEKIETYMKSAGLKCLAMRTPSSRKGEAVSKKHPLYTIGMMGTPNVKLFDENDNLLSKESGGNVVRNYFDIIKDPGKSRDEILQRQKRNTEIGIRQFNARSKQAEQQEDFCTLGTSEEKKMPVKGTSAPFPGMWDTNDGVIVVRDVSNFIKALKYYDKEGVDEKKIDKLREEIWRAPLNSDLQIKKLDAYEDVKVAAYKEKNAKIQEAIDALDIIGKIPFKDSKSLPRGTGGFESWSKIKAITAEFEATIPVSSYLIYYGNGFLWVEKANKKVNFRPETAISAVGSEKGQSSKIMQSPWLKWGDILEKADGKLQER